MGRTYSKVKYCGTIEQVQNKIRNVLFKNGFSENVISTREKVWKKGNGFLLPMQFVKIEYSQNYFMVSSWVQDGIGDIRGSETHLSGLIAIIPKQQLRKVVEEIQWAFYKENNI